MYDLANVNEDGGSVVLSPHLSAFLIAAIKVPVSTFPVPPPPRTPENPVCAAVHPGCAWSSREVEGLEAHRFGCSRRKSSQRNSRRNGLLRNISDSRTKKKIDSLLRKREFLSVPPATPLPSVPVLRSRVLSLEVSSGSISFSLSLSSCRTIPT